MPRTFITITRTLVTTGMMITSIFLSSAAYTEDSRQTESDQIIKNMNDTEIIKQFESKISELVKNDAFSGTILIAKDGNPLYHKAIGMASKSYDVPNNVETKFNIASMGKMFTGVAIAQLAEQGKLSFDDPVSKYLSSDWIKPELGDKIQIRHLLTHTSGFGTYFRRLYTQVKQPFFRGIDDYKIIIADEEPSFAPGEKWSYSNTGMHLLGVIIEKVSGESYYDYIRKNIYKPAGMTGTDAYDKDIPLPNRATGYSNEEGQWRTVVFTRVLKGGPSGGGYSTTEDMLNFDQALRSGKLLSPEYTDLVLSAKPEVGATFYGYGFFVSSDHAGRVAEHGGDGGGISTHFKMYLDSGYTIVVLSNYSRPTAKTVIDSFHQILLSK